MEEKTYYLHLNYAYFYDNGVAEGDSMRAYKCVERPKVTPDLIECARASIREEYFEKKFGAGTLVIRCWQWFD